MEPWTTPRTLLLGIGITSSATMTTCSKPYYALFVLALDGMATT
jgi:hypothetical protein